MDSTRLGQTSKIMLIEEFNTKNTDNAKSLDLFLDGKSKDEAVLFCGSEEYKELEVHSFEKFLEKFAPVVYETYELVDGKPTFNYTTNIDEVRNKYYQKKDITSDDYYKMLAEMYNKKGSSGESNLHFKDKDILDMLKPDREIENARKIRRQMALSLEKYKECEKKGENPSEYARKFIECRTEIAKKAVDPQSLLPLIIKDMDTQIKYLDEIKPKTTVSGNGETKQIGTRIAGKLTFDGAGNLTVIEAKGTDLVAVGDNKENASKNDTNKKIYELVEKDYNEKGGPKDDYVKSLVLRSYAPAQIGESSQAEIQNMTSEK